MLYLISLLLCAISLQGAVTIKYVRTSGGDYAATLAGLQSAVNDAAASSSTDPYIIDVEAGVVYSNALTCYLVLPKQTNATKLVIVRSSRITEITSRVTPTTYSDGKMVRIQNSCTASPGAVIIPPSTTSDDPPMNYVLQGIDAYYDGEGRNAAGAINIGIATDGATKARSISQLPRNIIIDRCWGHGISTQTWVTSSTTSANQNGIITNGLNILVINSRFSDNNMDGVVHGQAETRGMAIDNGTVLTARNNYIDGAIGSISGGQWIWIAAMQPQNLNYFGNYYTRDPWAWHWEEWDTTDTLDLTQPCIDNAYWQQKVSPFNKYLCSGGSWTPTLTTRTNRTWTKNGWECKNCRRAVVEGNVIYQIPATGDQSQYGWCALINNVDAQDSAFYARPEDIDFRFNICQRTAAGPVLSGGHDSRLLVNTNNVKIRHNLIERMGGSIVSPTQDTTLTSGGGIQNLINEIDRNYWLINNTFIYDRTFGGTGMSLSSDPLVTNITLKDNIFSWASVGQTNTQITNEACSAFSSLFRGAGYWSNQGMVDTNSRGSTAWNNIYGGSGCPSGNIYAATWSAVRFVNYNSGENGDYTLCTGSGTPDPSCPGASPFATGSSIGGPLGADFTNVSYASSGVVAGNADVAFFEFQIRRADQFEIRYTSYNTSACTGSIRNSSNVQVDSWNDGGGTNRDRTHTPSGIAIGYNRVIVTCAGRWKDAEFVGLP